MTATLCLILAIGILLATTILVSNTVLMAHNSPVNTYDDLSFDNLPNNTTKATSELQSESNSTASSSQFGWTYGNPSNYLAQQVQFTVPLIGPIVALPYTFILAITILSAVFAARYLRYQSILLSNLQISLMLFLTVLIVYFMGMILIFNIHPNIYYYNSSGQAISQWGNAHPSFYTLLFLQGGILSFTTLIWSQPITIDGDEKKLDRHFNNWRSFGSWIGTLFGAIGLSAALAFINNVTDFGVVFIRHILVLFGTLVALCMGFVIYKLRKLE
ncbi:hypothetical protein SAMN05443574_102136 [Haloarcula vallismortis]|uniref:Uncharacterized protein n=2 Tax=Haloarcula vallismortis TaxID=28442 RepID=A0A1H2S173_HALVA|nr:hypothetical protein SAMN05443574_102136 [Haloarcula vallismortis]